MGYRLVALDLDGTLVDGEGIVRPRVRTAVERMQNAGVRGCIVTGRMYRSAAPFAKLLRFDAPLICYQGAAVVNPHDGRVLREVPLAPTILERLIEMADADGAHLQLYRDNEYYCEENSRFAQLYAQRAGIQPQIVPSLKKMFAGKGATKAVFIADDNVAQAYAIKVKDRLGDRAYVTRSFPEFVEVMSPHVDKGEALRFVAQRIGVPLDQVLAIGDAWNDAPLLKAAGFGVAMGSAPEELRAVASAVVGDVQSDGVAQAIEEYVLAS